jgi:hypothetical protein
LHPLQYAGLPRRSLSRAPQVQAGREKGREKSLDTCATTV